MVIWDTMDNWKVPSILEEALSDYGYMLYDL